MKSIYTCIKCDSQFPKWAGRCTECGGWGTLELEVSTKKTQGKKELEKIPAGKTIKAKDVNKKNLIRITTGYQEFDRVLGDGIVPGSLMLLGGDPGIGKSTLVLQVAEKINKKILYISGEESVSQIKLRLDRLKLVGDNIDFLSEENVAIINKTILKNKPDLVIIDSIQTVYTDDVASEPGSVSQLKACAVKFLEVAKQNNVSVILVGHVTKEGVVAGPRALEHLVDVVLYLEGDGYQDFRMLRGVKNRFGSTNEVGIFEMKESGLIEVANASEVFLANRSENSGSAITAILEGRRVFLVEVQALVSKTVFGYPVRKSSGFDNNRLQMLMAVLSKRAKMPLGTQDVYINVVGGLKIKEPAIDLAVCLAIISAYSDKPIKKNALAIGEVGLGGEIRNVGRIKDRIKEAEKLGFTDIISAEKYKTISDVIKNIIR